MSGAAPILRELHRLRRHARDLQAEIERGPRVLKAHQAKLAKHESDFRDAQEGLKRSKMDVHEKEVTLKATHQQLSKFRDQLEKAVGQKEYALKQLEIANAEKKCQELEEQIFTGMTDTDDRTARLPEQEKALKQAREEHAKFEQEAKARIDRLTAELAQAQQAITAAEATLPEKVLPQYIRLITAFGADALAEARDRTCTQCRTGITAQQWNDLLGGQFVTCRSCSRGLYVTG
jgi:uncharacterized protein